MAAVLEERRYTTRETAALLRVSPQTLRRWAKPETAYLSIALVPARIGHRHYYTEQQIAEWQRQVDLRRRRLRRD